MDNEFKLSFLANQSAKTDLSAQTSIKSNGSTDGKSFESTLSSKVKEADTEKNVETSKRTKENVRNRNNDNKVENNKDRNENKSEVKESSKAPENEKPEERVEQKAKIDKTAEKASAEVVENDVPEENIELPEEISNEIIAMVAETLGVTPEQIEQSLNNLGIKPEDLAVTENVNALVMAVNGLKEPAELLKMSELQELHKNVNQIVKDALIKVEAAGTKIEAVNMNAAQQLAENAQNGPADEAVMEDAAILNKANEAFIASETAAPISERAETAAPVKEGTVTATVSEKSANVKPEEIAKVTVTTEAAEISKTSEPSEEITDITDGAEETEAPQNEQKTNVINLEAKNSENARSGNEQRQGGSGENSERPQALSADTQEQTPVIIQKGDETVVEIGGKTVSRTQLRPNVQATDVLNQIVDKMKLEFKSGTTEIKISLRPDDLGELTVKIATESGRVTAEIVTENSKIKELVEENISTLKESLLKQGVEVGELSVSVGQQDGGERMKQFMREQSKSHARLTQIINRITGEEITLEQVNYANEAEINGSTVSFSA